MPLPSPCRYRGLDLVEVLAGTCTVNNCRLLSQSVSIRHRDSAQHAADDSQETLVCATNKKIRNRRRTILRFLRSPIDCALLSPRVALYRGWCEHIVRDSCSIITQTCGRHELLRSRPDSRTPQLFLFSVLRFAVGFPLIVIRETR